MSVRRDRGHALKFVIKSGARTFKLAECHTFLIRCVCVCIRLPCAPWCQLAKNEYRLYICLFAFIRLFIVVNTCLVVWDMQRIRLDKTQKHTLQRQHSKTAAYKRLFCIPSVCRKVRLIFRINGHNVLCLIRCVFVLFLIPTWRRRLHVRRCLESSILMGHWLCNSDYYHPVL